MITTHVITVHSFQNHPNVFVCKLFSDASKGKQAFLDGFSNLNYISGLLN
jgi:hypothetical protein